MLVQLGRKNIIESTMGIHTEEILKDNKFPNIDAIHKCNQLISTVVLTHTHLNASTIQRLQSVTVVLQKV